MTRRPKRQEPRGGRNAGSGKSHKILTRLVIVLVAAAIAAVFIFLETRTARAPVTGRVITTVSTSNRIDGIPCTQETLTFHVHAHLEIYAGGKSIPVPAGVGINQSKQCLYWLHTHDDSGEIHIEAPHPIEPPLAQFFDIWRQPLSRTKVATAAARAGEHMRVWVDLKPYAGNPRQIRLHPHMLVSIQFGPPFRKPQPFNFDGD